MAWTEITRPKYRRDGLRYASDTTDEEWAVIEPQVVSRMMWKLLLRRLRFGGHDEVRRRDQEAMRRVALRGSASRRLSAW